MVALVGSHLVVAGGTCDFEDDPCAVEVMRTGGAGWELCESMPEEFQDRAAATWLSVAVSDRAMYVADRNNGWFSSFDPVTGKWGKAHQLRPDPAIYVSAIGMSGNRIILVGAAGEAMRVEGVVMWEVDPVKLQCSEIGRMPAEMLERLVGSEGLWTIGFSNVRDCGYIYNPSEPKEVFFCDFSSGSCSWEKIGSPEVVADRYPMLALAFGCSAVGMPDLGKLVA